LSLAKRWQRVSRRLLSYPPTLNLRHASNGKKVPGD
jgi:hypothetical protein